MMRQVRRFVHTADGAWRTLPAHGAIDTLWLPATNAGAIGPLGIAEDLLLHTVRGIMVPRPKTPGVSMKTSSRTREAIRVTLAVAAALTLSGCISISQRAIANGRSMSAYDDRAYNSVVRGNMSVESARALRSTYNPLPWKAQERSYPAFGQWWY
jgi:uncharacterized protein YceK